MATNSKTPLWDGALSKKMTTHAGSSAISTSDYMASSTPRTPQNRSPRLIVVRVPPYRRDTQAPQAMPLLAGVQLDPHAAPALACGECCRLQWLCHCRARG